MYDSKGKVMKLNKANCDKLPSNGNKPLEAIKTNLDMPEKR